MKKTVAIVTFSAALLVAGCGTLTTSQTGAATTSSPSTSQAVNCRLPVTGVRAGGGYATGAGFVSVPDGKLVIDANAELFQDVAHSRSYTVAKPVLYGALATGESYDRAQSRWVPAPWAAVSPDGSRYAYREYHVPSAYQAATPIHVVDVATGADRVVYSGGAYDVARYAAEGIYLVHQLIGTDASDGVWLLNPDSGSVRQIGKDRQWEYVEAGSAWSAGVDPTQAPPPQFAKSPSNAVFRLDLKSGAVEPWFSRGGKQVSVVGVDAGGHPFIQVGTGSTMALWLATGPASSEQILTTGSGIADPGGVFSAQADSAGRVWLASRGAGGASILLYQAGRGARLVVSGEQLAAHGLGLRDASPAGPCIP